MKLEKLVTNAWYSDRSWIKLLSPLCKLYEYESDKRKRIALANRRPRFFVPVVVVGNISVGGTGKTPLIIYLAKELKTLGMRVGVISRGYGAEPPNYPYLVNKGDDPRVAGDEPLLIAESADVPVAIDPDRCAAAEALVELDVDFILSDDGLQHYALPRDYEVVVVDGERGFGNGRLLPAGPLREPIDRLQTVDFVLCNGTPEQISETSNITASIKANINEGDKLDKTIPLDASFSLQPASWVNIQTGTRVPLDLMQPDKPVNAVAGIGNPKRFFKLLRSMGLEFQECVFPDHHQYSKEDFNTLNLGEDALVVMTMKDALKCRAIAGPNWWALDVDVSFNLDEDQRQAQVLVAALVALRDTR